MFSFDNSKPGWTGAKYGALIGLAVAGTFAFASGAGLALSAVGAVFAAVSGGIGGGAIGLGAAYTHRIVTKPYRYLKDLIQRNKEPTPVSPRTRNYVLRASVAVVGLSAGLGGAGVANFVATIAGLTRTGPQPNVFSLNKEQKALDNNLSQSLERLRNNEKSKPVTPPVIATVTNAVMINSTTGAGKTENGEIFLFQTNDANISILNRSLTTEQASALRPLLDKNSGWTEMTGQFVGQKFAEGTKIYAVTTESGRANSSIGREDVVTELLRHGEIAFVLVDKTNNLQLITSSNGVDLGNGNLLQSKDLLQAALKIPNQLLPSPPIDLNLKVDLNKVKDAFNDSIKQGKPVGLLGPQKISSEQRLALAVSNHQAIRAV